MRIIVNDIAASTGGALTILKSFYEYICESSEAQKHTWIFLLSERYIKETNNIKVILCKDVKKNWIRRLSFDLFQGKKYIDKLNPDLILSLQNTAVFGLTHPQVIYVQQAIPFQKVKNFSFFKKGEFKLAVYQKFIGYIIKKSVTSATHVIVQTKWMKSSLIRELKISESKVTNILPPVNKVNINHRHEHLNIKTFFYPADKINYKNHECIYEAVETLKKSGINDFEVKFTFNSDETHPNIKYIGKLPYEKMSEEFYKSVLIFPSYIETIGLPLLEARQCGALILASDTPFSREALENYPNAYFFNPFDPNELAEKMLDIMNKKIVKIEHKDSLKNSNSWDCVLEILESKGK